MTSSILRQVRDTFRNLTPHEIAEATTRAKDGESLSLEELSHRVRDVLTKPSYRRSARPDFDRERLRRMTPAERALQPA